MTPPPNDKELRFYVDEATHAFLLAYSTAYDEHMNEILRRIVVAWVEKQRHAATVLHRLTYNKGTGQE